MNTFTIAERHKSTEIHTGSGTINGNAFRFGRLEATTIFTRSYEQVSGTYTDWKEIRVEGSFTTEIMLSALNPLFDNINQLSLKQFEIILNAKGLTEPVKFNGLINDLKTTISSDNLMLCAVDFVLCSPTSRELF